MGAVGFLFGMHPPQASHCRMLELGCGQGVTLLALAQLYPQSEFHGIDLSSRHIENAQKMAREAGLTNVRFEHRDIMDINVEVDGTYDFITTHGVYSWVPDQVRDKILAICSTQLSPQGIAYVSYNTLPGWSHLQAIRQILIYHTARYAEPAEKLAQARTLIGFLHENAPGGQDSWERKWLATVGRILERAEPAYFVHEYLAENNEPCFFHQFMERAGAHELQYLSESAVANSFSTNLGAQASKVIDMLKRSVIDAEQYMDFARNTQFRTTLLCHKEAKIDRNVLPDRLAALLFSVVVRPISQEGRNLAAEVKEEFQFHNGSKFSAQDPFTKAAVHFISRHPAEFISAQAIMAGALALLGEDGISPGSQDPFKVVNSLLGRFLLVGVADISTPDLGRYLPERQLPEVPFAPSLPRIQAAANAPILRNSLHSSRLLGAAASLLPHCDGTHTREQLFEVYKEMVQTGAAASPVSAIPGQTADLRASFDNAMKELSQNGFLWKQAVGT